MEKSVTNLTGSIQECFRLPDKNWGQYSPLTLAYMGDAAYELVVRTIVVKQANCQPQKLHRRVTACVSAKAQCRMAELLWEQFTEEEQAVFRRGKNSKPYTKAKNASMEEYLMATGFEAVMGYLYLQEEFDRMNELIKAGLEGLGELKQDKGKD